MSIYRVGISLAVGAVAGLSALAQPPGGGFLMRGNQPLTVLTTPATALGKELKLSEELVTKIADIQKKTQDRAMAAMQELRQAGGFSPEAMREMQQKNQESAKKAETEIMALLSEDHKKALPDTLKALQVLQTLRLPLALHQELALTDDQRKQLVERAAVVQKERDMVMKQIQEAMQNQDMERVRELGQSLRGSMGMGADAKALAILTPEQKAMVEKYLKENPPQQGFRRGNGN